MKLICPKCRAGVKIGGASRFWISVPDLRLRLHGSGGRNWLLVAGLLRRRDHDDGLPVLLDPLEIRSGGINVARSVQRRATRAVESSQASKPNSRNGMGNRLRTSVKSLKGILLCQRGADLIHSFKDIKLCPAEYDQVKEMVREAIRRGTASSACPDSTEINDETDLPPVRRWQQDRLADPLPVLLLLFLQSDLFRPGGEHELGQLLSTTPSKRPARSVGGTFA